MGESLPDHCGTPKKGAVHRVYLVFTPPLWNPVPETRQTW